MSTAVPFIPDSAPFSPDQRAWLNGFFAGLFSRTSPSGQTTPPQASPVLQPLTILFGSQTGTAEGLAKRAAKEAGKRGFAPTLLDMAQTSLAKLGAEKNLLLITSTYGDGEPPDNAKALHAELSAAAQSLNGRGPLGSLRFSVCSLGDTNYTQFCKCGADFDAFFEKLGAARSLVRVDCDLDYEAKFTSWLSNALGSLSTAMINTVPESAAPLPPSTITEIAEPASGFGRSRPFPARLLVSRNLNGVGSAKQVHHVEFDLADSGLVYEAGDALGVVPHNCPALVSEVLAALSCDGEEAVTLPDGTTTSLRRAITELYDLGKPTSELLAHFPSSGGGTAVAMHHVVDVLLARPDVRVDPSLFVRSLKKLHPRLYSISSSPQAHPGHVHLTVGAVRYELNGRARKGVCSTFLTERAVAGESRVGVFVHSNPSFRPPAKADTPMIMVGPGTGIAPFRAFLHERRATGARGRNWLFFGDQRSATDYLYRDELDTFAREKVLTRIDTAFSRDQAEKVYVQQRMLENATELFAWLEAGAHFYVCGDASRMAKDVDRALHLVIERAGGKTADQAAGYVQALKAAKRYARDVY